MTLSAAYRISIGGSLVLATLTIGLADQVTHFAFYTVAALLIVAALTTESYWTIPAWAANLLGVVILAGWALWLWGGIRGMNFDSTSSEQLRLVLPRMAPLLCLLLLAKLIRPKVLSDHWLIHGLGLVLVILASVLGLLTKADRDHAVFPVLVAGYVFSAVWSLWLFSMVRDALAVQPKPMEGDYPTPPRQPTPWLAGGVLRSIFWFALVSALALAMFYGVPRPETDASTSLEPVGGRPSGTVGYTDKISVRDAGRLDLGTDPEPALFVKALDSAGKPVRLLPTQRFRGGVATSYRRGEWWQVPIDDASRVTNSLRSSPETLGPGELELTIELDLHRFQPRSNTVLARRLDDKLTVEFDLFLAESVHRTAVPPAVGKIAEEEDTVRIFWLSSDRAALLAAHSKPRRVRYRQILPPEQNDWPVVEVLPGASQRRQFDYIRSLQSLADGRSDQGEIMSEDDSAYLRRKSAEILQREGVSRQSGETAVQWARRRATALEHYLARSGDYHYSLDRKRVERGRDPTVDFLKNSRQGHCELFASALTLLLRAQGIPARLVRGFRGAEWNDRLEANVVYQQHAHVWVEALIGEPQGDVGPRGDGERLVMSGYWLALDGTPAGGDAAAAAGGLQQEVVAARYYWEAMFLDYDRSSQRGAVYSGRLFTGWAESQFWSALIRVDEWSMTTMLAVGGSALVIVAFTFVAWKRWRRVRAPLRSRRSTVDFYNRLLRLLQRVHLSPVPAQTPSEFAANAGIELAARCPEQYDPGILSRLIQAFYGVRYGEQPLTDAESDAVDRNLRELEDAIRK